MIVIVPSKSPDYEVETSYNILKGNLERDTSKILTVLFDNERQQNLPVLSNNNFFFAFCCSESTHGFMQYPYVRKLADLSQRAGVSLKNFEGIDR